MPFNNNVLNGGGEYVPPDFDPPDTAGGGSWADIANIAGAVTAYKVTNFAAKASGITTFNDTYPIIDVAEKEIVLGDPDSINDSWTALASDETIYFSPKLSTTGFHWVGPFTVDMQDCEEVVCNFTCPQGLFRFNQEGEPRAQSVSGLVEVTPVNEDGTARGGVVTFPVTLTNSPEDDDGGKAFDSADATLDKSPRGKTLRALLVGATQGLVKVRFRRTTPLPEYKDDQFTDELAIRDCYGIAPITQDDFGNITTVHTRVQATSGMTAQKERKMQCTVTRKVLERNVDDTFGPALVPSQSAADIICHMALDPYLGGRSLAELDVPQIYATVAEGAAYFDFPEAMQFNFSFDDDNVSFEEMVQMVANAVYCTAYRQGSVMRLFLEHETPDSTMLFNHRNKLPGSETRTVRFGVMDDNDGVEFNYRTFDGEAKTIFIPPDQSAVKPKKIERAGVVTEGQATIHAYRIWNRMRYQHTTVEFDATAEASQLVLNERIEVADNTRPDVFDGHIVSQDGLVLELSQPFVPVDGVSYSIFIQLPTGGLDVIGVTPYIVFGPELVTAPLTEYVDGAPNGSLAVVAQTVVSVGGGAPGVLSLDAVLPVAGQKYRLTFDVADFAGDGFTFYYGDNNIGHIVANGSYSFDHIVAAVATGKRFAVYGWNGVATSMTVSNISLKAIVDEPDNYVVLQAPTSMVLPLADENWADVVYQIVGDTDARATAFIVSEKGAYDKRSVKMQAINYDSRYYTNDLDFSLSDELTTEGGDILTTEGGDTLTTEG